MLTWLVHAINDWFYDGYKCGCSHVNRMKDVELYFINMSLCSCLRIQDKRLSLLL